MMIEPCNDEEWRDFGYIKCISVKKLKELLDTRSGEEMIKGGTQVKGHECSTKDRGCCHLKRTLRPHDQEHERKDTQGRADPVSH